jgi:hypothetical protein
LTFHLFICYKLPLIRIQYGPAVKGFMLLLIKGGRVPLLFFAWGRSCMDL